MHDNIQAILDSGKLGKCFACEQTVKKYRRKLYGNLIRMLAKVYNEGAAGFEVPLDHSQSDFCKLAYWGLVVKDNKRKRWYITDEGVSFFEGTATIPRYVYVFNRTVYGFSDNDQVSISQCLAAFDLGDL